MNYLLKSLNIKRPPTFDIGNADPGLGQAQTCGRVKLVNGNQTLLSQ
jgi:hypothetical protein